jgi:hypothetical protein
MAVKSDDIIVEEDRRGPPGTFPFRGCSVGFARFLGVVGLYIIHKISRRENVGSFLVVPPIGEQRSGGDVLGFRGEGRDTQDRDKGEQNRRRFGITMHNFLIIGGNR